MPTCVCCSSWHRTTSCKWSLSPLRECPTLTHGAEREHQWILFGVGWCRGQILCAREWHICVWLEHSQTILGLLHSLLPLQGCAAEADRADPSGLWCHRALGCRSLQHTLRQSTPGYWAISPWQQSVQDFIGRHGDVWFAGTEQCKICSYSVNWFPYTNPPLLMTHYISLELVEIMWC